jgi:hypothetical protein
MTRLTPVQAIAEATATLTQDYDLTDALARLVAACADLLPVEAIGLLVIGDQEQLELLTSTSHRVAELEAYQIQQDSGPCVEAIRESAVISVCGADAIQVRWPAVGAAILAAGYDAVSAFPLRWHGFTLGAMNTFESGGAALQDDDLLLGQTFADIAAVLIVQNTGVTMEEVTGRVQEALRARTAIERAKGVLAYQHGVGMAEAYQLLLQFAKEDGATLTVAADRVILEAGQGRSRLAR